MKKLNRIMAIAGIISAIWAGKAILSLKAQVELLTKLSEHILFAEALRTCERAEDRLPPAGFDYKRAETKRFWIDATVNEVTGEPIPFLNFQADGLICSYSPLGKTADFHTLLR